MSADTLDLIAGAASLVLTLFVFSYLLGDNFLYRLAVHVLVGVTAGYITVVALEGVIAPWLRLTIFAEGSDVNPAFRALGLIPFVLILFVLLKAVPRLAPIGNLGMAFIIGLGTGVAVVGAVAGTVIPLTADAGDSFDQHNAFNGLIMVLGTIGTLVYFQYLGKRRFDGTVGRSLPMRVLAWIGQVMIAITFGAVYAGAVLTSLNVFTGVISDQLTFLLNR